MAARARVHLGPALLAVIALGGCSLIRRPPPQAPVTAPLTTPAPSGDARGEEIAATAAGLLGAPYEFGGADAGGFDCSGLALYVYAHAGIAIPRTAREQQRAAQAVPLSKLAPGDLVFFAFGRGGVDHVGVYLGHGQFVHAPHRGVAVSVGDLANEYFAHHLVNGGRFSASAASVP
ncbi:MAG: C40 family peptidase [Proteobacteria bacterium]|nr:C40 family peptidase [Pseudomonadota bacterium]